MRLAIFAIAGGFLVSPLLAERELIRPQQEQYPPLALAAMIDGKVELKLTVQRDGSITKITPISGPNILKTNAAALAGKWRFSGMPDSEPPTQEILFTVQYKIDKEMREADFDISFRSETMTLTLRSAPKRARYSQTSKL